MKYKEYVKTDKGMIRFSIYYNKQRGYWVSAVPVKITQHEGYSMEESGAFTGFTDSLLQVDRQSEKRLKEAVEILNDRKIKYLAYNFKY